jgi:FKBP-type peptidyl-prolyl cis-trans isomerase 2
MVKTHYIGTFDDGVEFDSSYSRDEPIEFVLGRKMMIPGFDNAVQGMEVGQIIDVRLEPEDAYGPYIDEAVQVVPIDLVPGADEMIEGEFITMNDKETNMSYRLLVVKKDEDSITFDSNHPLAGKALNFKIELVAEKKIAPPGER